MHAIVKRLTLICASLLLTSFLFAGNPNPSPGRVFNTPTTPANGTNEIQTVTFSGTITGGTFILKFANNQTGPITWSSTNATLVASIDAALEALNSIRTSGVTTAVGSM